ncbi:MAG: AarF/ABC1/UbiB kinase family protein [Pseudomonadota bacterium]
MADKDKGSRALAVPSGRVSRLVGLGSMATGIMGNVMVNGAKELGRGNRPELRDLLITPSNLHRATEQLAKMRGAAMKIGQLISMDGGDVLPQELADILGRLRSDAHFMPPVQLRQTLNAHWPKGWLNSFQRFETRPIAAASIGQVHRAKLQDGREIAIKVQYPGVARSIDSDVANVGTLMRLSGLIPKGLDVAPYLEEAKRQLHEETDYAREGAHLTRFGERLAGSRDFTVPEFYPDWSTEAVLAMSFEPGQPIETLSEADQDLRDQIAHRLIDLTLRELFEFGEIQSDPNFANFHYNAETGRIILLDFGAVRAIEPALIDLYRRLMAAAFSGDLDGLWDVACDIGFVSDDIRDDHQTHIRKMMALLSEAFQQPGPYDFADRSLSKAMQVEGEALARAGFLPPPVPMDVLYLQRKFGGLFLLAGRLGARVPLREIFEPYLKHPVSSAAE